jgi:hypothetical protein
VQGAGENEASMSVPKRRQLTFERVDKYSPRIKPNIFDSESYSLFRGELVELYLGKRELVFSMNFFASRFDRDAVENNQEGAPRGWAVFQLAMKGPHYYGQVVDSRGCLLLNDPMTSQFHHVGEAKTYPGHRRRHSAAFLMRALRGEYPRNEFTVNVFLKPGFFAAWKEIIVAEPGGDYCLAYP